jgi:hypothetical protein
LDAIIKSLPVYMMIGIVLVIGISQFNRILGGSLGVLFWIAVALIGNYAYDEGHILGLPGIPFTRALFFGMCALFTFFSAFTVYNAYVRKTRFKKPPLTTDDEDGEERD